MERRKCYRGVMIIKLNRDWFFGLTGWFFCPPDIFAFIFVGFSRNVFSCFQCYMFPCWRRCKLILLVIERGESISVSVDCYSTLAFAA